MRVFPIYDLNLMLLSVCVSVLHACVLGSVSLSVDLCVKLYILPGFDDVKRMNHVWLNYYPNRIFRSKEGYILVKNGEIIIFLNISRARGFKKYAYLISRHDQSLLDCTQMSVQVKEQTISFFYLKPELNGGRCSCVCSCVCACMRV